LSPMLRCRRVRRLLRAKVLVIFAIQSSGVLLGMGTSPARRSSSVSLL
jgi:hypothetical protein